MQRKRKRMGDKFTKKKRGRQTKGDKRLLNEKFKKQKKMKKYNKCIMVIADSDEAGRELTAMADRYRNTTHIKAYGGPGNTAVFFPVDEYDQKHIEDVLNEKGFFHRIENAE